MRKLQDLNITDKRVFLRGDIDVPLTSRKIKRNKENDGDVEIAVEDDTRLQDLVPTIRFLLEKNCQIILAGHLDRPGGRVNFSLSTKHIISVLSSLLNIDIVHFTSADSVKLAKNTLGLFENLRFWPGEESNDEEFAKQLANLTDVYVNEAFAVSHRQHASIVGVPKFLPHAAGFRLQKEVEVLSHVLQNPKRPQVVIIGGVKLETKLPLIENLAKTANWVLIGGLIAEEARRENLQFPKNVILANLTEDRKDITDQSIEKFKEKIKTAGQIIFNGAMGVFEKDQHAEGTR